jgi:hypothetical protein
MTPGIISLVAFVFSAERVLRAVALAARIIYWQVSRGGPQIGSGSKLVLEGAGLRQEASAQ